MREVSDRLLYVASLKADFHAGNPQLSGDVIDMFWRQHNRGVTANTPRSSPEVRLQHTAIHVSSEWPKKYVAYTVFLLLQL